MYPKLRVNRTTQPRKKESRECGRKKTNTGISVPKRNTRMPSIKNESVHAKIETNTEGNYSRRSNRGNFNNQEPVSHGARNSWNIPEVDII